MLNTFSYPCQIIFIYFFWNIGFFFFGYFNLKLSDIGSLISVTHGCDSNSNVGCKDDIKGCGMVYKNKIVQLHLNLLVLISNIEILEQENNC